MKPTTLDIKRTGDLDGQKITMGIDESSFGHLMSVLTNLYSNPKLAVIREYCCNARDSHIAAGKADVPIEVNTPNTLSPYFSVKDYGVGLDIKDIEEIYSKYGASTKRGGNDQVGMLGLGCKSGLTYASQFNVTAVKDGMKAIVTVSLVDDGHGVMEVVQHTPTDEPNSVEISIPQKRGDDFLHTCRDFFRFWEPGTVLLNGVEPPRISGDAITKNMVLVDNMAGIDYIVMGGVAYPVKDGLAETSNYRTWGVVANVGIGEVNFTPSREDLHYTGRTKACIEKLREEFKIHAIKTVEKEVSSAPTYRKAIESWQHWTNRFGDLINTVKYKGQIIETVWQMPSKDTGRVDTWNKPIIHQPGYISYRIGYGRGSVHKHNRTVRFDQVKDVLCVINYPFDDLPTSRRSKIKFWMDENNVSYNHVWFFPEDVPGGVWTSEVAKVEYDDVKALKVARTGAKYATGYRFEVIDKDGNYVDTNTLDTNLDIAYFSSADHNYYDIGRYMGSLADKVQVVKLSRNRWDKFNRDFPTGVNLSQWVIDNLTKAEAALSELDKIHIWLDNNSRENFAKIDETKIDDPEVVKFVVAAKDKTSKSPARSAYDTAFRLYRGITKAYHDPINVENPMENYPLIQWAGYRQSFHPDNWLYMNAKYKETNKPTPLTVAKASAKV